MMRKALGRTKAILLAVVCLMTLTVFSVACTLSTYAATHNASSETELAAAVAAALDGDVIEITQSFEVTNSISINKDLTIKLNGNTLTSKLSSGSMISVSSGKTLTVEGGDGGTITSAVEGARAIETDGILAVKETTFSGFYAQDRDGGGVVIYKNGSSGNIEKCSFVGNKAVYNGGAVLVRECKDVIIKDSSFKNNRGGEQVWGVLLYDGGGAVCIRPESTDNSCTISGCTFEGNTTHFSGGAVDAAYMSNVTIKDSVFKGNSCDIQGGAIAAACAEDIYVINNTVDGNYAKCGWSEYSDNYFRNRIRSGYGGGVAILYSSQETSGNAVLEGNKITNNKADLRGGGISSSKPSNTGSPIVIKGATYIEGNEAEIGGGIDYTAHRQLPLELDDALITGNEAVRGGGIWLCPDGSLTMISALGGTIVNNKTSGSMRGLVHNDTVYANGDDICHEGSDSEDYPREISYIGSVNISTRGSGGVHINWLTDETGARSAKPVSDAIGEDGYPDILNNGTDRSFGIHGEIAGVDDADKRRLLEESEKGAKIFIRNNKAIRGGGIAANSPIQMGVTEDRELEIDIVRYLEVRKKWQNETAITSEVKVNLLRYDSDEKGNALRSEDGGYVNLTVLDRNIVLKADSDEKQNWRAEFKDLPSEYTKDSGEKQFCNYTVEEIEDSRYFGVVTEYISETDGVHVEITNIPAEDEEDVKDENSQGDKGNTDGEEPGNEAAKGTKIKGVATGDEGIAVPLGILLAALLMFTAIKTRRRAGR